VNGDASAFCQQIDGCKRVLVLRRGGLVTPADVLFPEGLR
jgi:hypothetical protein